MHSVCRLHFCLRLHTDFSWELGEYHSVREEWCCERYQCSWFFSMEDILWAVDTCFDMLLVPCIWIDVRLPQQPKLLHKNNVSSSLEFSLCAYYLIGNCCFDARWIISSYTQCFNAGLIACFSVIEIWEFYDISYITGCVLKAFKGFLRVRECVKYSVLTSNC